MSNLPLAQRLQTADSDTLKELMRETEAYLDAQLSSAIAADQRAYTFAGTVTAASVLLVGAAYALATAPEPNKWLAYLSMAVASCLFIAAWMAVMSARSVDFEFCGNQPSSWIADIEAGTPLLHALAEQCAHYDEMATANRNTMNTNSWLFNWAVNVALGGVGVGGLAFMFWAWATLP